MDDRNAKDRQARNKGEKSGQSKLNDEAVRKMRLEYAKHDVTLKYLGNKFGVTETAASYAIRGKTWSHID